MRSKMLGLAIALSTFGLGVAATTVWIAYHAPAAVVLAPRLETRQVIVAERAEPYAENSTPCAAASSINNGKPIRGGILQGKAISKPQPAYPPAARAEGVSGTVQVEIVVDECGNVASALAISGPPLLQQAAVDAAMKMRYTPTRLSGQPVKVSGTVAYNFLLQ
jgi:TonB family protein